MLDSALAKEEIRSFITRTLIHDADYPLADDEPLVAGGLIDSASLFELAEFIEETYGVHVDADELGTENVDTLTDILDILESRLV